MKVEEEVCYLTKDSQWLLNIVLRLSRLYHGKLQYSAAYFLTLPISIFKLMTDNIFQSLLHLTAVIHH